MAITGRRSKYRAVPTVVDGIRFASKREAKRYMELRLLERAGEIRSLQRQLKFPLYVLPLFGDSGVLIGCYVADFVYEQFVYPGESKECKTVVEDSKGFRTPLYRWKKRHVEAQYGIQIREV